MKNIKTTNGGYIGILMILIVTVAIVFFMFRTDVFDGKEGGKSVVEKDLEAIDAAKEAKMMIEAGNQKSFDQ